MTLGDNFAMGIADSGPTTQLTEDSQKLSREGIIHLAPG